MKNYRVEWVIDIEAESAEDASRQALAIQRNPLSIATVFNVLCEDSNGDAEQIDLTEIDESTP